MADINSGAAAPRPTPTAAAATSASSPSARQALTLIELLFFAYRDFVSDPDAALADLGFGRAHHRILHFVTRNPGIRVADLLEILKITKQSLGRVLKQLIDNGFIEQLPGPVDRRQRLLHATSAGKALAQRLIDLQTRRVSHALAELGPGGAAAAEAFLRGMIDPAGRARVQELIDR
ncbi:MAG: MarR family transcriptional regulator [Bauldia sp.]